MSLVRRKTTPKKKTHTPCSCDFSLLRDDEPNNAGLHKRLDCDSLFVLIISVGLRSKRFRVRARPKYKNRFRKLHGNACRGGKISVGPARWQFRTQSPLAFWSADGRQEILENSKKYE